MTRSRGCVVRSPGEIGIAFHWPLREHAPSGEPLDPSCCNPCSNPCSPPLQIIIAHEQTDVAWLDELRSAAQAEVEAARSAARAAQAEAEHEASQQATRLKEEAKLKAKKSKEEVKVLAIRVRTLEAEKLKLGFQCAAKQQEADIQHTSRLQQEDRAEAAEQREQEARVTAELQVRAAKEQLPALQAQLQQLIAEKLTLQGQVSRAWHEADVEYTKHQRTIAVLEKKVSCHPLSAACLLPAI
jgi:hypothetical protein